MPETVPYDTLESAFSSVVHVTVAVVISVVDATEEITGAVTSGATLVVNVMSDEVARFPAASRAFILK